MSDSARCRMVRPMQVGNAVFRDYVVHVGSRSQDACAVGQPRHDSRYRIVLRSRRKRNDWLAVFRACRPADEIQLPAKAAVELRPDRLGANLPRQIDLDGRVDGHHAVILRDAERIVGVGRGMKLEDRIFVEKLEQLLLCPTRN